MTGWRVEDLSISLYSQQGKRIYFVVTSSPVLSPTLNFIYWLRVYLPYGDETNQPLSLSDVAKSACSYASAYPYTLKCGA
jgi:hypothetical protein